MDIINENFNEENLTSAKNNKKIRISDFKESSEFKNYEYSFLKNNSAIQEIKSPTLNSKDVNENEFKEFVICNTHIGNRIESKDKTLIENKKCSMPNNNMNIMIKSKYLFQIL